MKPASPPPHNTVEQLLADMRESSLEPETFAKRLIDEQVFMPVRDDKHRIAGFQSSTKAQPLIVDDDDGNRVLILFTVPERAKDFLAHYPGHSGGLVAEFSWILRRMGPGIGISLNPGQELGFDFDPDMVAMLISLLPEQAQ